MTTPAHDPELLSPRDVEPLLACLDADEADVRRAALETLVTLPLTPETWRAVGSTCLELLDRHGADPWLLLPMAAVPLVSVRARVRAFLDTPDPYLRSSIAYALAERGDPTGIEVLVDELEQDDEDARLRAARGLARAGLGAHAQRAWTLVRHDSLDDVSFFVALAAARSGDLAPLREVVARMRSEALDLRLMWGDPEQAAGALRELRPLPPEALAVVRDAAGELPLLEALLPDAEEEAGAAAAPPDMEPADAPDGRPAARVEGSEGSDPGAGGPSNEIAPEVEALLTHEAFGRGGEEGEEVRQRLKGVIEGEPVPLAPAAAARVAGLFFTVAKPYDLELGNLLVRLIATYGAAFRPDIGDLFRGYRHHASWGGPLARQAAWVASRAGLSAVIRHVTPALAGGASWDRVLASKFVREVALWAPVAYGPEFGGETFVGMAPPPKMIPEEELGAERGASRPPPPTAASPPPPPAPPPPPPSPASRGTAAPPPRGAGAPPPHDAGAPPPPVAVGEGRGDGGADEPAPEPDDVYALLDCDEVVEAGVEFELEVGLAPRRSEGVLGGPLTALRAKRNYFLTVQVIADGFSLRAGESRRRVLAVTDDQRFPTVTLHLTADPVDQRVEPRGIQATYTVDGEVAGVASRALVVVADRAAVATVARPGQAPGRDLTVPVSPVPPDLTVVLFRSRDSRKLLLTMESPHAGVPLPAEELAVDIGEEPRAYADGLVRVMSALEGKRRMYRTLLGKGRLLARMLPDPFWTALRAARDAVGGAPSLLLVSEDPYVPWELSAVEPPFDETAAPFLSAQTVMGRWVLRDVELPPPHELEVATMVAVAGDYAALPRWENLEAAFEERASLSRDWGAESVDGTYDAMIALLERDPSASIVHVALHGKHSPDSVEEGLVLVDGEWLSPDVVQGTTLRGHPFVFLNACQVGSGSVVLSQYAGMAAAFLVGGASGVVAPLWNVKDSVARSLALAFYERSLGRGVGAGEALRAERAAFREVAGDGDGPGVSSTLMAYQFFGHPALRLRYTGARARTAAAGGGPPPGV
jgi:hypothetical protein